MFKEIILHSDPHEKNAILRLGVLPKLIQNEIFLKVS